MARDLKRPAGLARARLLSYGATPSAIVKLGPPYVLDRLRRREYRSLSQGELLSTRTSEIGFVFGSGRSLLDISSEDWRRIARCNTIGFSEFVRQRFVRVDYHMIGEVFDVVEYAQLLGENSFYDDTVLLVQEGWAADDSNALIGRQLLPKGRRIFRYRRTGRARFELPSRSFSRGLVHGWNSSISVTNFALLMGFKAIVLTGVDLYDKQYFWLEEGERREALRAGSKVEEPFVMSELIVDLFGRWRRVLAPEGIRLLVYNPKSLLTRTLDVFTWDDVD